MTHESAPAGAEEVCTERFPRPAGTVDDAGFHGFRVVGFAAAASPVATVRRPCRGYKSFERGGFRRFVGQRCRTYSSSKCRFKKETYSADAFSSPAASCMRLSESIAVATDASAALISA